MYSCCKLNRYNVLNAGLTDMHKITIGVIKTEVANASNVVMAIISHVFAIPLCVACYARRLALFIPIESAVILVRFLQTC